MSKRDVEFEVLYAKADAAGKAAVEKAQIVPMVVGTGKSLFSNEIDYSKPTEYVADGVCGFAYVQIKPGNSAFAKWMKAQGYARKDEYLGGISMSVRGYNQSMQKKSAYAYAFADILSDAGIRCYAHDRED